MYIVGDQKISLDEAKALANEFDTTVEELAAAGGWSEEGKTTVPEETTPPTEPEKTKTSAGESSSGDTLLESQDPAKEILNARAEVKPENLKVLIAKQFFNLKETPDGFILEPKVVRTYNPSVLGSSMGSYITEDQPYNEEEMLEQLGQAKYDLFMQLSGGSLTMSAEQIEKLNLDNIPASIVNEVVSNERQKAGERIAKQYDQKTLDALKAEIPTEEQITKKFEQAGQEQEILVVNKSYLDRELEAFENAKKNIESKATDLKGLVERKREILEGYAVVPGTDMSAYKEIYASYEDAVAQYNAFIASEEVTALSEMSKRLNQAAEIHNARIEANAKFLNETIENSVLQATLAKDYSIMGRIGFALEDGILGTMASVMGLGADAINYLFSNEEISEALDNFKARTTQYTVDLEEKRIKEMPIPETYGDLTSGKIGVFDYAGDVLLNNSATILTVVLPTGVAAQGTKIAARGATATVRNKIKAEALKTAARLSGSLFFVMEAGGSLQDIDASKRQAMLVDPITGLTEMETLQDKLDNNDYEGQMEKSAIEERINTLNAALNVTEVERAFTSIVKGGIATTAEMLGSIRSVQNAGKWMKGAKRPSIIKNLNPSISKWAQKTAGILAGAGKVAGIELTEETLTLLGHNLADIQFLDMDKPVTEGLDADFIANVVLPTLAISGPGAAGNVGHSLSAMYRTKQATKRNADRISKIMGIQERLETANMSEYDRQKLEQEKIDLLNEMSIEEANVLLNASQLDKQDLEDIASLHVELNKLIKKAYELGQGEITTETQSELEKIQKEIDEVVNKKEQLLQKTEEQIKEKAKDAKNVAEAEMLYAAFLRNQVYAKASRGDKFIEITEEADLENVPESIREKVAQARQDRKFGINIDGYSITFNENVEDAIFKVGGDVGRIASVVGVHEVGHDAIEEAGGISDAMAAKLGDKLIQDIVDTIEAKAQTKEITQEQLTSFKERLERYKNNVSSKSVLVNELIAIINEMKASGVLSKNDFQMIGSAKAFLNRVLNKIMPGQRMFIQMKNYEDVSAFLNKFQSRFYSSSLIQTGTPKEELASLGLLDEINALVPDSVQTQADFFDRKVFNPIYNDGNLHPAIANYIRSRSVSKEEADKITESVADRLINFNPAATRKSGDAKITFGEFLFSNVNFGKLDARKALFEESQERAQAESTDSEQARQIATVETTTTVSEKPKYKTLTQRRVLSEETMAAVQAKVLSVVRVLKSPIDAVVSKNVTVTPLAAEIKKAVGKQLDIDFKKEMGGLKDGQLRKYLLRNKAAILENMTTTWLMTAMPNAVQKQVGGVWTSDWKGKKIDREKVSTDNAGRTSGAEMVRRLPKAATRMSDADFLSNFFNEDGSLIRGRKESLAKAMGEEMGFEIVRQALADENSEIAKAFIAAQERAGVQDMSNLAVKFDVMAERGNVKFSEGLDGIMKVGRDIRTKFDMELPSQRGKMINKLLKIHGVDSINELNTTEEIDAWAEDLKLYVLPLLPKEFWFTKDKNGEYPESKSSAFRNSHRFVGDRSIDPYFVDKINELRKLPEAAFGKPIEGLGPKISSDYNSTLGKTEELMRAKMDNGDTKKFNDYHTAVFKHFWFGINDAIKNANNDPAAVRAIAQYLSLVSNMPSHPHKMGAEFIGYSTNAKGDGRKTYEWEHAMPATNAYVYLMDAVLNGYNFTNAFNAVSANYKLIALDKAEDLKMKAAGLNTGMPQGWDLLENDWWERYTASGIDISTIIMADGRTLAEAAGVNKYGERMSERGIGFTKLIDKDALNVAKEVLEDTPTKKTTPRAVFMVGGPGAGKTNVGKGMKLGRRGFKVINQDIALEPLKAEAGLPANEQQYTKEQRSQRAKLGAQARKLAEEKMAKYTELKESMVVDGTGASYNATMKKVNALREAGYEVSIVFANTSKAEAIARNKAREERALPDHIVERTWEAVQESSKLYKQEFGDNFYEINTNELKLGEDLPQRFLDKLYKDLEVQEALYSEGLSKEFNEILERKTSVASYKEFSRIQAQLRGKKKGRFKFFIHPSADDFRGLVHYAFAGKGKQGEADIAWLEEKLLTPYFRGIAAIDAMRQQIKRDFKVVTKQFREEYKLLSKQVGNSGFTYDHALRVYMWDRQGLPIEGLAKRDKTLLLDAIAKNPELVSLADALLVVSRRNEWPEPTEYWEGGSILGDLNGMTEKIGRKKFLAEFIENAEIIFSEENLNKIEALFGSAHREAIEDSLYSMKNGTNRRAGTSKQVGAWLNWINGSTGAIMFFNRRSALLQMLSFTNFINWSDNNPAMAAAAFANQKQYWKDWAMIFNSDKLKERRGGLKQDVSDAELAAVANRSKNSPQAILAYLLKIGFTPTQIADSMAIATGGAMFYRNRVNTYLKQDMDQAVAEEQAFLDFAKKSDEAQQSSDPALVSQQQRSVLGRMILAFANTPMQYTRLMKKAGQDLINGRGNPLENISKIAYYGVIQNFIFSALQSAMFALLFDDDEEDDEKKAAEQEKRTVRTLNSMLDTVLRGSGIYGAVASTVKNTIMEFYRQEEKGFLADHTYTLLSALNLSPPIGSKARKLYSAIQTRKFEKDNIEQRGWSLTADGRLNIGPNYSILGNVLSGVTNVPMDRVVDELNSITEALDARNKSWQRIALALGWKTWDVGARNEEADLIKAAGKEKRKQEGIEKAKKTRGKTREEKKGPIKDVSDF